jgi:putative glycosyltransferase (TIGR04348 family)
LHIAIVTPAPPGSRHGNRNTAQRWAAHLRALGHTVDIALEWTGQDCDALVALHARRSHASIKAFKSTHSRLPLVLVLTGTDLYRDIRGDAGARESLRLADRMVVLQSEGLAELSAAQREKTRVITQSVHAVKRRKPPKSYCLISVIGHLREEKDPFRAALALARLPADANLRVVHLGKAMSADYAREARALERREPRYRWLGELTHAGAMRWLARSHAMVISSFMEGGAHVVSEAIGSGVPVLASAVSGNVGLLGRRYPAFYPAGDDAALARLLTRTADEAAWRTRLETAVTARRHLVDPALERRAIAHLIADLARLRPDMRS